MGKAVHNSLTKTEQGLNRVDLRGRGLRMPQHTFATRHWARYISPMFAAPLRPNETIVGMNLYARSMLDRMTKVAWMPPIEAEFCVWKVPLSTIGDYFVDLLVADSEDHPFGGMSGTAVSSNPAGHTTDGPNTNSAHQYRLRQWAGEIGYADGVTASSEGGYTPYVSASVWHVARMYYELELGASYGTGGEDFESGTGGSTRQRQNDDLWQERPYTSALIRSTTYSAVGAGLQADEDDPPSVDGADSLAQWAENLSLMSKPNQTYAEYLADFGVSAARIRSMPEPLIVRRQRFDPIGTPQIVAYPAAGDSGVTFGDTSGTHGNHFRTPRDSGGAADGWTVGVDGAGLQLHGTTFDVTRGRRIMIDEPSILLGTFVWWPYMTEGDGHASHIFDITRMTHGSHWGNPRGGLDEADFLSASVLRNLFGTGEHINEDERDSPFAYNLLNLYLNGDTWSNGTLDFGFYEAFGERFSNDRLDRDRQFVNTLGKLQLAIATDLVGS